MKILKNFTNEELNKQLLWSCKPCKTLHKPHKIKIDDKSLPDNKKSV